MAGMFYGWSAMSRQRARKQAEAIEALRQAGGRVYLDYQWRDGQLMVDARPPQAAWLRRLMGPEMLDRAVAVDLRGIERPDDLLRSLLLLPYLADLNASDTSISDVSLETIQRLTGLARLDLSGTAVSDKGLGRLERLPRLTSLKLSKTGLTDAGVEALGRLKNLRRLELGETGLSDEAIVQLTQLLPKCEIQQ